MTNNGYVAPMINPPIPNGRCTKISTILTNLSSITCITGPTPRITTKNVTNITTNGVMIKSNAFGMIFRSFFSRLAPISAVTIAVNTLP